MQGGTEARAFKRATRRILDANDAATKSSAVSSLCLRNETNGSPVLDQWLENSSFFRVCGFSGFGLWSASGEVEHRQRKAFGGTKPERNAAAEPQTEARRPRGPLRMPARDERAVCGVERAWSRGGRGDGQPVKRCKPRVGHGGVSGQTISNGDVTLELRYGVILVISRGRYNEFCVDDAFLLCFACGTL